MSRISIYCDLRSKLGIARDQGIRPTCLAFAATDCHAASRNNLTSLSVEYIFYHAQSRAGHPPSVGASLTMMLDALREDGQPIEADWPYLKALPGDLAKWKPPRDVGAIYRALGEKKGSGFDEIVRLLEAGVVPLVLMTISDAFYTPNTDGVVRGKAGERPDPSRRHATIAVGHGRLAAERVVLLRNSWGLGWGLAGHAWLPESFVAPRLTGVAVLRGINNVSSH